MAKYTKEQIQRYVIDNGWADEQGNIKNPQAIYDAAKQFGVSADELDMAGGWKSGTANDWIKQNGQQALGGGLMSQPAAGAAAPAAANPASSPMPFGQSTVGSYQDRLAAQRTANQGDATSRVPGADVSNRYTQNGSSGVPSGYVNPQGQGGYPPGYNASNAPMYGAGQGGAVGGMTPGGRGNVPSGYVNPQGQGVAAGGMTPDGYGQGPSQGGRGYYEQQTPAGSFAAANQQQANAYGANAYNTNNPYIGQTSQGIQGAPSVMQYAKQAQYNNPYLGQQSERSQGAGQNAYAGENKYLQGMIDKSAGDMTRAFNQGVVPQLDRMAQQSGSFGNSGVQQMQNEAYRNLGENIGNVSNQMRFQDYTTQQGLAESALNRGQQNNQFNAGLSANDLSRNMAGGFQQNAQNNNYLMQGAMFDAGNALNTQQFNASLGNNDLTRNSNLAQAQGQFNTGALNTNSMFNAGNMNTNSMFNAGQGNNMNQFNASAGNNMLENYRNRQQNQGQFDASLNSNNRQFDASLGSNNRQFDASLGNNRYQFDQNLGSQNRQFDATLGQNQGQFDANLGNNRYQFDQSLGSQNRQFDATLGQNAYQFNENLDRNIYNDNMGWANQGFQNTRGLMNDAYGWANGGVGATTAEQNTPMNYWQQFANAGNAAGGQGGTSSNSQNMQGNPYLGAWAGWNMFAPKP